MSSSFSGKNGRNAAVWAAGQLQDTERRATDVLKGAETRGLDTLQGAETRGLGALSTGMEGARTNYGAATGLYDPLRQTFTQGANAYADATGANGQAGYVRAAQNFHTSPGYTQSVNAGLDSVQRRLASLGQLGSGNAQIALNDYAQNRQNDQWNSYLSSLAPYNAAALQSTAGQAGTLTGLGNLEAAGGGANANLITGSGGAQAGLIANTGGAQADLINNTGNQIAQVGMQGFKAGDQAAANRMSAIQGGAKLAATLVGGALTGGAGLAAGGLMGGLGGAFSAFGKS